MNIEPDKIGQWIEFCSEISPSPPEGFIPAAMELLQIEKETGKSHTKIAFEVEELSNQRAKLIGEVEDLQSQEAKAPRNVRIRPSVLHQARVAAVIQKKPLRQWLEEAIVEKIEREEKQSKEV